MNFKRIKETCLYIEDLAQAKDFYATTLGLEVINYLPAKHLFLRVGDSVLLCFNPLDSKLKLSPPAHYAEGKQHFAFEVDANAFAEAKEQLVRKGIKITDEITWKNGQKSCYFEDPAGNVLEIVPAGVWDN
ncbi:MAG TPA: VOC family protein [Cyclobacteriaceae bacterium]|nr:VOC family protein [Cyclobacteriaceae bacterium]